ncbi:MAG: ATP-grasp domain-containing protein [Vicinamibacterales bacterium]
MARSTSALTVVCLASYFKGGDFLRQCRARGCRVILIVKERLRQEDWPFDAIDVLLSVPNAPTAEHFVQAVVELARGERVDRVIALEEYDVLNAALVREHLRLPGMGMTTAFLFRDKLAMRVKAVGAGVVTPDFVHLLHRSEIDEFVHGVAPPWVLKPRFDVASVGIQKLDSPALVWQAIDALDARPALNERSSHFLLERYVPGDVFHVDSLVDDREVVYASVGRYWRPPLDVAHRGGVFMTSTLLRQSPEERALLAANRAVLGALNMVRGATHAEFIRAADGQIYFLEVAARVGGAYIAEVAEAATGINIWREWADIELLRGERQYRLPQARADYAGVALALARQEWPDTSAYDDAEIVHRVHKRHHVGLIVRSATSDRVHDLLERYGSRFVQDFLAVLPPPDKPE